MMPLIMHSTSKETVIYIAEVLYKQQFIIICIVIISELQPRKDVLGVQVASSSHTAFCVSATIVSKETTQVVTSCCKDVPLAPAPQDIN